MSPTIANRDDVRVIRHFIAAYKLVPNCTIVQQPLLVYRQAFSPHVTPSQIEQHLSDIGAVQPQWRYTMYSRDHFHSTTHEVLVVFRGHATLCFGHKDNPLAVTETVSHGDAIVIPAGVSHSLLEDAEGDFNMVGSYPVGQAWDMCYGHEDEAASVRNIGLLPWFEVDPIFGGDGPALEK